MSERKEKAQELYTMKEISEATGIGVHTLQGRRKRLGIQGSKGGYTMDEVKRIIKKPPGYRRKWSAKRAALLRAQLRNDGAI